MINGYRDGFFYPILTEIMCFFSCSAFKTVFFYILKRIPEVLAYTKIQHNMITSLVFQRAAVQFLSFQGVGTGYVRYNFLIWIETAVSLSGMQENYFLFREKSDLLTFFVFNPYKPGDTLTELWKTGQD